MPQTSRFRSREKFLRRLKRYFRRWASSSGPTKGPPVFDHGKVVPGPRIVRLVASLISPDACCLILSIDRVATATYLAGLHLFWQSQFTEFIRNRCAALDAQSMMRMMMRMTSHAAM